MIPSKDKIKGAKPLMADKVCSFFRAGTPKSIGDSIISSIIIEVKGVGILNPKEPYKGALLSTCPSLSLNLLL